MAGMVRSPLWWGWKSPDGSTGSLSIPAGILRQTEGLWSSSVRRLFTIEEARAELSRALPATDEVIELRAQLIEGTMRQRDGDTVNLPDLKAGEARLSEIIDGFVASGIEVKGFAPLLLDFPALLEGREVLLCWLEGEADIGWYHEPAHGFTGRRRLGR